MGGAWFLTSQEKVKPQVAASPSASASPSPKPSQELTLKNIAIGEERTVQIPSQIGLSYFPDTNSTIWNDLNGSLKLFVTAKDSSYLLEGPDLDHLHVPDKLKGSRGEALPILKPPLKNIQTEFNPTRDFGNNYRGFGSILAGYHMGEMIGIFHGEDHFKGPGTFRARIGITMSQDGGVSWNQDWIRQIIKGRNEMEIGTAVTGAGQPSAIINEVDDKIYLYYTDWSSTRPFPDSIHLARVDRSKCLDETKWEKLLDGKFVKGNDSTPVVLPPKDDSKNQYASLASVSYNTSLSKFLMIFESSTGFYFTTSKDGVKWEEGKRFFKFGILDQQARERGDTWYSYPTLFSPGTVSSQLTREGGLLLCSKAIQPGPHHMVAFPFKLEV